MEPSRRSRLPLSAVFIQKANIKNLVLRFRLSVINRSASIFSSCSSRDDYITYAQNDVLALGQVILFISQSQPSIKNLSYDVQVKPLGEIKPKFNLNAFANVLEFSDDDSSSSEIFLHQMMTVHDRYERHSPQPSHIEPTHQPTAIIKSLTRNSSKRLSSPTTIQTTQRKSRRHRYLK